MFRFDPNLIKVVWSIIDVEEIVNDATIDMSTGDIELDMGQAESGGLIDQGNVING